MADVFDLDAFKPKDRKEPFVFRFSGEEFVCADPRDFDVRVLGEATTDPALVLALLLGEEGWERLDALDATFTIDHLNAVTEAFFEHHGLDAGKSPGSPKSSKVIRMR